MNLLLSKVGRKMHEKGAAGACLAALQRISRKASHKWEFDLIFPHEVRTHARRSLPCDLGQINERTLTYIESNRHPAGGIGSFSYTNGGPALLYASAYAALTLHLCGKMGAIPASEKREWANFILSYQCEDGIFRDRRLDCPLAEKCDWWGWRHMTLHALMALRALDARASKPFLQIAPFARKGKMQDWLEARDWKRDPTDVSSEIQNLGTFLQYARDFQDAGWCEVVLEEMFDWLDRKQDAKTGLWGDRFDTPAKLASGVQTGYHLWMLYFYDQRPVCHVDRVIDSCLKTQNKFGGFGLPPNTGACEDIDTIDPLVRLSLRTNYRREDVQECLKRSLSWVLFHQNTDGGWVFRRRQAFEYGHRLMRSEKQESAMFASWFRTLSLAHLSQILPQRLISPYPWQFLDCPGHQFWKG